MKVNKSGLHGNTQFNRELLEVIESETLEIKLQGFDVLMLGDFNAHTPITKRINIKNYPHRPNDNGHLVDALVENTDL